MLIDEEGRSAILAPIDGSAGLDGREDGGEATSLLREIRRQRKQLVGAEQRAAQTGDDLELEADAWDWEMLVEQSTDYLSRFSKDLEPMSVLIEASVRSQGPDDLADMMTLLAELVETFWDQGLYPAEDEEDGITARFQPLSGLSGGSGDKEGALILPLRRMTILAGGGGTLRYIDKVGADATANSAQTLPEEARAARIEKAEAVYQSMERVARSVTAPQVDKAISAIATAEQSWRKAVGFISEHTKPQMPAASQLSQELSNIGDWLKALRAFAQPAPAEPVVQESAAAEAEDVEGGAAAVSGGAAAPAGGPFHIGKVSRREDALRAIAAAADYFSVYEPLSPIGETLREVDRRARMSLHELLGELIPDESARDLFYWRSGIKPPGGRDNSDGGGGFSEADIQF